MKTMAARDYSARDYHEFMLASEADRGPRAMFQRAVCSRAPRGSSILDFGAGSGIDAKFYAGRGYRVRSYDASPDMRGFLSQYCRGEIETGQISVIDLDFDEFLEMESIGPDRVDAITANFAVFNLIRDHAPLFKAFDRWLSPGGFILVGIISPYRLADAGYSWWWRHLKDLLFTGRYDLRTREDLTYRYGVSALKRAAAPHFALEGIVPSTLPRGGISDDEPSRAGFCSPLSLCLQHYMFLLFRRCQACAGEEFVDRPRT